MTNLTHRQETSISNTEHNKLTPVKKFNSCKVNQKVQTVQTFHSKKKLPVISFQVSKALLLSDTISTVLLHNRQKIQYQPLGPNFKPLCFPGT